MKTNNIKGIICLTVYFLFAHQALAADWVYFASNSVRDSYYDKSNIIKVDKNIIRVWTKQILSEKGKVKTLPNLKSKGTESGNLDLISYILKLSEIDCANKKIKDSSVTFYDEKSNLLYSSPQKEIGNWDDIIPHSIAEKLKNILCDGPVVSNDDSATVVAVNNKYPVQVSSSQNDPQHISEEDIRALVNKWLVSWQSGDMENYRSCYDEHFESKNMRLDEWIAYKSSVRNKSKNITIRIDDLKISANGDSGTVEFVQTYVSSILKDKGNKTLKLKKVGNEWKIYGEIM